MGLRVHLIDDIYCLKSIREEKNERALMFPVLQTDAGSQPGFARAMKRHGQFKHVPKHWIGVRKWWQFCSGSPIADLVSLPPDQLRYHALLIGATGSGKTNLIHHLIAQDIMNGHSFAVLDLRGDLVSAALELCAGHVDPAKVAMIDLREKVRPFGFNPLHGAGEPYFRALSVLAALESEADSWGVQLSETLRNALMLLAETGEPLTRLDSLFYDRAFRTQIVHLSRTDNIVQFWQRFDELSTDRQGSLAMPVLNKVSLLLATPTLRRILGHPTPINLGSHLNTPGNITLVSLAVDEMHGAARMMGGLVLSAMCREVFARVAIPESRRNHVRMYVDEFEHFGMKEFETILAEGRRYGLVLVLAHQTLAQLTPKMRSLIFGIIGTKVVFRSGRDDGSVLSRDLFGNPSAYDFTELPTGDAVLWRRNQETIEIEVNEPIVRDVGYRSDHAQRFIEQVYSRVEKVPEVVETSVLSLPAPTEKSGSRLSADLGDWL